MDSSSWAVLASLVLGSACAVQLLRASARVDSVNAVVLTTLADGRGHALGQVLEHSGAALYLRVARAITGPLDKLWISDHRELRRRLQRDAQTALLDANRRLRRLAWPNTLALVAIGVAGVLALTGSPPSGTTAVGMFAATLLWLSNAYGARTIALRMRAGAQALVDGLVEGAEELRAANPRQPAPSPS